MAVKKVIKFDAANISDSFNEVNKYTIGDGLIKIPSIFFSSNYLYIGPFSFIHKGIICFVSDFRTIEKPSSSNYYIYVDSNTSNENADIIFYLLTQKTDAYILVAEVQNGNEVIYPELTTIPSIRETIKYQISNNLKGSIYFDKTNKQIKYKDLIHTHGIDTTFLTGSINVPDIGVPNDNLGSVLITPKGEILPWGSEAVAESNVAIANDYGNWLDAVPLPEKNVNIIDYASNAGSTIIFKSLIADSSGWSIRSSGSYDPTNYQSSYPTKTKKIRNSNIGKDTLTVGIRLDASNNNRFFLLTTSCAGTGTDISYFNINESTIGDFLVSPPLALDFDTHDTTPDVAFIGMIDFTNNKLQLLRVDNYGSNTSAQIDTSLNISTLDQNTSKLSIKAQKDKVYATIYGPNHNAYEYEYDYNLTSLSSSGTVLPNTSLYDYEFVNRLKASAFTYDDGTNLHLIYNDGYSAKDIVLDQTANIISGRIFISFTKNYLLASWQGTDGNVHTKLISRNLEKDLSTFSSTYYLENISQLHNGFEGIFLSSAANINAKILPDDYIVVPDDTPTLAIATYDGSGNIEVITSKRGTVYSQSSETRALIKHPNLDIDTLYDDWIASSGRSIHDVELSGTIRIKSSSLPPIVIKGGKIIVDSGTLGGGGTISNFTYDDTSKKVTLTSGTIKDYGIAPGTEITYPVSTKVIEIDKIDYKWFKVNDSLGTPTTIDYVNKIVVESSEIDASTTSLELRNVTLDKCKIDNSALTINLIGEISIKNGSSINASSIDISSGLTVNLDLIDNHNDWTITNDGTLNLYYENENSVNISGTGTVNKRGELYVNSIQTNYLKEPFQLINTLSHTGTFPKRHHKNVLRYSQYKANPRQQGILVITAPKDANAQGATLIIKMRILWNDSYHTADNDYMDIILSLASNGSTYFHPTADIYGRPFQSSHKTIQIAKDNGKLAILLGSTNSQWANQTSVVIDDVFVMDSDNTGWDSPWTVRFVTDTGSFSNITSVSSGKGADRLDGYDASTTRAGNKIPVANNYGYLNSWIKQGSDSGLDADLLDGNDSSYFKPEKTYFFSGFVGGDTDISLGAGSMYSCGHMGFILQNGEKLYRTKVRCYTSSLYVKLFIEYLNADGTLISSETLDFNEFTSEPDQFYVIDDTQVSKISNTFGSSKGYYVAIYFKNTAAFSKNLAKFASFQVEFKIE